MNCSSINIEYKNNTEFNAKNEKVKLPKISTTERAKVGTPGKDSNKTPLIPPSTKSLF